MNPIVEINQPVQVIAIFSQETLASGGQRTIAKPLKIRWNNQIINITQLGLHHIVRHGATVCHIFNVSDGVNDYSLEFDSLRLTWKLLSVIDGGSL